MKLTEMNTDYQAILTRVSTRRYDPRPLSTNEIDQVETILNQTIPLSDSNHFEVRKFDYDTKEDLVERMGAYGHILSPPHYLLPIIQGPDAPLVDAGNQSEQIAVQLNKMDFASCFVGCAGREDLVRELFDLKNHIRIGAFLIFGRENQNLTGKGINRLIRSAAGARHKYPVDKIFFEQDFDHSAIPTPQLAPIIEAARHAPSAVNAQPWRLLWSEESLWVFVTRFNPKYRSEPSNSIYAQYDGGICIGNMILAMKALGIKGDWSINPENEKVPQHPESLIPLAKLQNIQF